MSRLINKTLANANFEIWSCCIENIVAHSDLNLGPSKKKLDIQALYENHSVECTYQMRLFPGAILRCQVHGLSMHGLF